MQSQQPWVMNWGGGNLIAVYNIPAEKHEEFSRQFPSAHKPGFMCDGFTILRDYQQRIIDWINTTTANPK